MVVVVVLGLFVYSTIGVSCDLGRCFAAKLYSQPLKHPFTFSFHSIPKFTLIPSGVFRSNNANIWDRLFLFGEGLSHGF